jgi:hypothetical protein
MLLAMRLDSSLHVQCYDRAMEEDHNGSDLRVSVVDDAIIVTMPGTSYSVTYRKRNEPWLLASDISDDKNSPISRWTFRARAWTAANEKVARTRVDFV